MLFILFDTALIRPAKLQNNPVMIAKGFNDTKYSQTFYSSFSVIMFVQPNECKLN